MSQNYKRTATSLCQKKLTKICENYVRFLPRLKNLFKFFLNAKHTGWHLYIYLPRCARSLKMTVYVTGNKHVSTRKGMFKAFQAASVISDVLASEHQYLPDKTQQLQQTSMPSAGFETATPAGERLQTHALDSSATDLSMSK